MVLTFLAAGAERHRYLGKVFEKNLGSYEAEGVGEAEAGR